MSRDVAVAAAERGWVVFPLKVGEKFPATPKHKEADCNRTDPWCRNGHRGWEPRATTDPERIRRGWAISPYNVGIACGPSRLVVVDLDMPKPDKPLDEDWKLPGIEDGKDVFIQICEWAGMDFPVTYTVATPSGGWHLYFRAPEGSAFHNTASKLGPLVDTRANGGYVVGAGSVTAAGKYEVLYDEPVQPLPRWIAHLLEPKAERDHAVSAFASSGQPGKRLEGLLRKVASAKPGSRNDTLFWAGKRGAEMVASGEADERDAAQRLLAAAACAGLSEDEAKRTITSAMKGTR